MMRLARYPVAANDMSSLAVLVLADPQSLSRRMNLLEQNLFGGLAVRLAVDASGVGSLAVEAPSSRREEDHCGTVVISF